MLLERLAAWWTEYHEPMLIVGGVLAFFAVVVTLAIATDSPRPSTVVQGQVRYECVDTHFYRDAVRCDLEDGRSLVFSLEAVDLVEEP